MCDFTREKKISSKLPHPAHISSNDSNWNPNLAHDYYRNPQLFETRWRIARKRRRNRESSKEKERPSKPCLVIGWFSGFLLPLSRTFVPETHVVCFCRTNIAPRADALLQMQVFSDIRLIVTETAARDRHGVNYNPSESVASRRKIITSYCWLRAK